jgi:AAA15 family ATPase/GTPase
MTIAEFTVENFRSFKNRRTFSLLATPEKELVEENTFQVKGKQRFLKSAVLYGANASGKSNFFEALILFRIFTVFSGPLKQIGDYIPVDTFQFSKQTQNQPSSFEIVFFIPKSDDKVVRYRYGFSVTHEKVIEEYLFAINNTREVLLFSRDGQEIKITKHFKEGLRVKNSVRPNCALLSVCAQINGEIATSIISSIGKIFVASGLQNVSHITRDYLRRQSDKRKIVDFLRYADIRVKDLNIKGEPVDIDTVQPPINAYLDDTLQGSAKRETILFGHTVFDNEEPVGEVYLPEYLESSGTQKLFAYSIPVLDTLEDGGILFIDEFDAQLHPLILENIVKLFNSPLTNPKNAQLVISCHAVNILTNNIFRRDQIWFCEKDEYGATDLYSLAEYKKTARNDASYNKDYLRGKYGAVPYVNSINLQLGQKDNGT